MEPSLQSSPDAAEEKDLMRIVEDFPPNFSLIKAALPLAGRGHTYCYGNTIYNPSGKKMPIDMQFHELIHMKQQETHGDIDLWWNQYLTDPAYRLAQEIEAYGLQYKYCKTRFKAPNSFFKWMKENMATALSGPEYGSLIGYSEAESTIRRYAK